MIVAGNTHPGTSISVGSAFIVTLVTKVAGAATTPTLARSPDAVVTLPATQQFPPAASGFCISHQPPSALLPRMATLLPTCNAPTIEYSLPGPKRQLTGSLSGVTIGTEGVGVGVMVGVSVGLGVSVSVGGTAGCVSVGATGVVPDGGVSLPGTWPCWDAAVGRLQASITLAITISVNKGCFFMPVSPP